MEYKLIVDAVRFTYSGMFDIDEFFKELDDWTDKNGFERDVKKKLEHVEANGKRMEYVFELWKDLDTLVKSIVRIRALFNHVTEFDLKRGKHERVMQKGKVAVIIDGFLQTDYEYHWMQKPWYFFLRAVYDKLVWKVWTGKYDNAVAGSCNSLYNKMFGYFKRYKH